MARAATRRTEIPSKRTIQQTVQRVVDGFRPERVYLFGSHAYGTPTRDSDVDLLVVMKTRLAPAEQAAKIREWVRFPFATDLLVRTPAQMTKRMRMGDIFIQEITAKGRLMYEAHNA